MKGRGRNEKILQRKTGMGKSVELSSTKIIHSPGQGHPSLLAATTCRLPPWHAASHEAGMRHRQWSLVPFAMPWEAHGACAWCLLTEAKPGGSSSL